MKGLHPALSLTLTDEYQWTARAFTGIVVPTSLTALVYARFGEHDQIGLTITNTGANAFTQFVVKLRDHVSAPASFILADSSALFADRSIIGCVGTGAGGAFVTPTTLGSTASVKLTIPRHASQIVEVLAAAGTASALSVYLAPHWK